MSRGTEHVEITMADLPHVQPKDRREWRAWLKKHHATSSGVWLIYDKKAKNPSRLTWPEAVEEALCFGWIDSVSNRIDEHSYKQRFTPRKATSTWSKINRDKVQKLEAAGLMTDAGRKMIAVAKETGRWLVLDTISSDVPEDLLAALKKAPAAKKHFEAFSKAEHAAFARWINGAKRPETRAARIQEAVELAAKNVNRTQLLRGRIAANRKES